MFAIFGARPAVPALYRFVVWKNGRYVEASHDFFSTDHDAVWAAESSAAQFIHRGSDDGLNLLHMHIVRADGVHIKTLELLDTRPPEAPLAAQSQPALFV